MKRTNKKPISLAMCRLVGLLGYAIAGPLLARCETASTPAAVTALSKPPERAVEERVNPHWREPLCATCHPKQAEGDLETTRLVEPTARANCDRCHSPSRLSRAMHHPYDVKPTAQVPAPPNWPLEQGRAGCLTCHDILRQCRMNLKERWRNPLFLRTEIDAPPVQFCLNCHRRELYQTSSPHDQIDDEGREREGVCLHCHQSRPVLTAGGESSSTTLRSEIRQLCGNCHGVFPHPLGIPHLAEIKEKMLARMVACELQDQFVIPLGRIQRYVTQPGRLPRYMAVDPKTRSATCTTCHNPHEVGVLPPESPSSRGAEGEVVANYRLRMPKDQICNCCHRL